MFDAFEVPVAHSMIAASDLLADTQPIERFIIIWIAFNNIYITLGQRDGLRPKFRRRDGAIQTKAIGTVQIPKVEAPTEKDLIEHALMKFDASLKHRLIKHPNTEFFVYRTPKWRDKTIKHDANGQQLNGVLNVGRTVNNQFPVWSPIETDRYQRYVVGRAEEGDADELSKQIVFVLYTIRNNSVHGGKRMDDANDRRVARKGLPLLSMIVEYFLNLPTME